MNFLVCFQNLCIEPVKKVSHYMHRRTLNAIMLYSKFDLLLPYFKKIEERGSINWTKDIFDAILENENGFMQSLIIVTVTVVTRPAQQWVSGSIRLVLRDK